uniref:Uncharacterized mitochondrial protein AtMg00810-like n=1 Tax=Nicotiana tabacum TaxID=4097 RepID=A0A1S3YS88_TOBAC|nr:PREDICTED: uncharacterized mitochondrial protein AtMg00810-like [Nicotiana tabacum]
MHGDLSEEVYMKVPLSLSVSGSSPDGSPLVCRLTKSLYGLKQASRQWFSKLSIALISKGYRSNLNDYSLFTKNSATFIVVLAVYVDDILLAGDDTKETESLKYFLDAQFKIKDLGNIHYFLGLEVSSVVEGYLVNQHKFAKELLAEFNCSDCTPVVTPLDLNSKLTPTSRELLPDPSLFKRVAGKLNFLQHTRPDLSFSMQHLSQFLNAPKYLHMQAALHVLRYLLNDPAKGMLFNNFVGFSLIAYSDSDWATCYSFIKSVTDFFVILGGNPIFWKSKKQPTVSLSSVEAEYRALRKIVAELTRLIRLLGDLGVYVSQHVPIYYDNQAALSIAMDPVDHEQTKHIELDCYFVGKKLGMV